MNNIYTESKDMFSEFNALKDSILGGGSASTKTNIEENAKLKWATAEGFVPHYNPNMDEISWVQRPKTALEKLPNYMQVEGSMSPEELANRYPIFQWKANEGLNVAIQKVIQDCLDGVVSVQHAEELLEQMAIDSYPKAKKATKWNESHLSDSDKVGTKEARSKILMSTGGDVATVSKYVKELSGGE